MPRIKSNPSRPIEYFLLVEPRAAGPVIGYYAERPIADAVVDCFGRRFIYKGVAPRLRNGRFDVESLQPGEWIVEPGLVYFGNPGQSDGLLKRLRSLGHHSAIDSF
jgi:hypothetical protein